MKTTAVLTSKQLMEAFKAAGEVGSFESAGQAERRALFRQVGRLARAYGNLERAIVTYTNSATRRAPRAGRIDFP
jgi:hypothetical protein